MKRIIGFTIVLFSCLIGVTFSDNTNVYDCTIATTTDGKYNFLPGDKYIHILPEDAMKKAFENLRFACCKQKILSEDQCKDYNENGIFPESVYLFDHLLDVYLRRLDAKQEDVNGGDLVYGLEPDPLGKERREFISQLANDSDGTPPTMINEKYKEFWKGHVFFEKYPDDKNTIWLNNVENKAKSYDSRNLADRYNNACNVVMMMYINIFDPISKWNHLNNASAKEAKLVSIYNSCDKMVSDRVSAERSYTEAIMQQKGSVFLDDTLNAYLNTYFLENKLSGLHDKIFNRGSMFKEVVKGVDKLVKKCS